MFFNFISVCASLQKSRSILINLSHYLIFITCHLSIFITRPTFYDYISYYIVICAYCMLFIVA